MSFFEKKYYIESHYGDIHLLTAKQLCERIVEDSKSDYNWIAPARELVRVCKKESFPAEYAIIIKVAILNCFANIEHRVNCGGDRYRDNPADKEAVHYCYNSLYSINKEEVVTARKRYLTEMISLASRVNIFDSLYHPGPTFRRLREEWAKSKFEEYISKENIDFEQLVEILRSSFTELIKNAESNGDFEEDEKRNREEWQQFYEKVKDIKI